MTDLHPIQREIMRLLTLQESGRYSTIKPDEVDGNLFMYHLGQLIEDGYVAKREKTYDLTTKGRRHAAIISVDTGEPRLQSKIVTMIYAKDEEGRLLLFRWRRQPFYGRVSLPYGKTHFGASIQAMAERELNLKTGLQGTLRHRGDLYVQTSEEGELLSHMLVHLFELQDWNGELIPGMVTGEAFWARLEDIPEKEWAPGLPEIVDVVEGGDPGRLFFAEIAAEY